MLERDHFAMPWRTDPASTAGDNFSGLFLLIDRRYLRATRIWDTATPPNLLTTPWASRWPICPGACVPTSVQGATGSPAERACPGGRLKSWGSSTLRPIYGTGRCSGLYPTSVAPPLAQTAWCVTFIRDLRFPHWWRQPHKLVRNESAISVRRNKTALQRIACLHIARKWEDFIQNTTVVVWTP